MENLTNELENTQDEITLPEECEKSEKALESISDESVITHYAVINLFVIAIIALITAISFIVLTDDEKVDDISNPLTFKTFASGKFTSNLEESYIRKLPFPYEFKTAGNRLAFAPDARWILSTFPLNFLLGYVSIFISTVCPGFIEPT